MSDTAPADAARLAQIRERHIDHERRYHPSTSPALYRCHEDRGELLNMVDALARDLRTVQQDHRDYRSGAEHALTALVIQRDEAQGEVRSLRAEVETLKAKLDEERELNGHAALGRELARAEDQLSTLRVQLQGLEQQMFEFVAIPPSRQQTRIKSAREMVELFARDLHALLASLPPVTDQPTTTKIE